MAGRVIGFRGQGEVAMNRSDDGLDRINTQSDQLEGAILERDGGTDKQRPAAIYALEVGWAPGRRPTPSSSFKSNLSVIAASAKLIVFIGVIAILYFGRPVFVRLAVAILLAFILAPLFVYCAGGASAVFRPSSLWFCSPFLQFSVSPCF
jgi:hypothetical protein